MPWARMLSPLRSMRHTPSIGLPSRVPLHSNSFGLTSDFADHDHDVGNRRAAHLIAPHVIGVDQPVDEIRIGLAREFGAVDGKGPE